MKKYIFAVIFVLFAMLCFSACSVDNPLEHKLQTTVKNDELFAVTLSTPQYECTEEDISDINYTLEIDYIGEAKSIEIWGSGSLAAFSVIAADGGSVYEEKIPAVLKSQVIYPDEPYIQNLSGQRLVEWFGDKKLESDVYTVRVWVTFALDENLDNDLEYFLELPLVVK